MIDFDPSDYDAMPRKRRLSCQCGPDLPGTCPGVENCPHSGYGEDEGDNETTEGDQ
ncbi:hypothetical protein ACFQUU_08545 [Herbaspirillum sp. GCM10030257]|uniref:hypothetical protein n=1 Tax=Herbaspirillum sp. GCM10030257 TaxID=3273393 RepID=UPI00360A0B51